MEEALRDQYLASKVDKNVKNPVAIGSTTAGPSSSSKRSKVNYNGERFGPVELELGPAVVDLVVVGPRILDVLVHFAGQVLVPQRLLHLLQVITPVPVGVPANERGHLIGREKQNFCAEWYTTVLPSQ